MNGIINESFGRRIILLSLLLICAHCRAQDSYDQLVVTANSLLKQGRLDEAKQTAQQAIQQNANGYMAYAVAAKIAAQQGASADASNFIQKALEVAPDDDAKAKVQQLAKMLEIEKSSDTSDASTSAKPNLDPALRKVVDSINQELGDCKLGIIAEDNHKYTYWGGAFTLALAGQNLEFRAEGQYKGAAATPYKFTITLPLSALTADAVKPKLDTRGEWGTDILIGDSKVGSVVVLNKELPPTDSGIIRGKYVLVSAPSNTRMSAVYYFLKGAVGQLVELSKGGAPKRDWSQFTTDQVRAMASNGDAAAAYEMGWLYQKGLGGLTQDFTQAVAWLRKAAEEGNSVGQVSLGFAYENGQGVDKDLTEAEKWYRKAAEQGDAEGENNMGVFYQHGFGVEKDLTEAEKWYHKSAEQGNASGQNGLGVCYLKGWGVDKDLAEAGKWYRKAAEQGNADGEINLGYCYQHGDGVEKDLTEAANWYRKSAEQGNAVGQVSLGFAYENSLGVEKDLTEAEKWYRKSAEQGNADGENNLGYCYERGWGVEKDLTEAANWYRKAAALGNATATTNLARLNNNPH